MRIEVGKSAKKGTGYILFKIAVRTLTIIPLCIVLFISLYLYTNGENLVFLISIPVLFILAYKLFLSKIITLFHEKIHSLKAETYGYETELITDKKWLEKNTEIKADHKIFDARMKKKKKKINGFCDFKEGVDYNPEHIQKIYLQPLKALFIIYLLVILVVILGFVFQKPIAVLIFAYLAIVFASKIEGCSNDIREYFDVRKNKERIQRMYYKDHRFYIEIKEKE